MKKCLYLFLCALSVLAFTIQLNAQNVTITPSTQEICNGAVSTEVEFFTYIPGTTYEWTNSDPSIGLASSGTGNIASFRAVNNTHAIVTASITLTPSTYGCHCMDQHFTITVLPTPSVMPLNQSICNGATSTNIAFSGPVAGTTYTWVNNNTSIGLASGGAPNITDFVATNNTNKPVHAIIRVIPTANGCVGATKSFTVTVNPTPTVNATTNKLMCSSELCPAVYFSGSVSGTTFSWTNSDSSIGLGGSGTGNINSFTAINSTGTIVTSTVSVTPFAIGCSNTPVDFEILIKPSPEVTSIVPGSQVLCNGSATDPVNFVGSVSGNTFSWTNSCTTMGLAASGMGNIPSFNCINNTSAAITATFSVTASYDGCVGMPGVFSMTVNPTPVLNSPLTAATCSEAAFSCINSSSTAGAAFSWSRAVVPGISNPAAIGTGNIDEALTNTTDFPIAVSYLDTLIASGCINTQTVTVTVNPTPWLSNAVSTAAICNRTPFSYEPTCGVTGATFNWHRPIVPGIKQPAGNGIGNPNEMLDNSTNSDVAVTYVYTITANACSNTQNVTVGIHPTPLLLSHLEDTICSGDVFSYLPSSSTDGTTFTWRRLQSGDITPATASGTGSINEVLSNGLQVPIHVAYVYTLTANGCVYSQNVGLWVDAAPAVPSISVTPFSSYLCANTLNQIFGAATPPPPGMRYVWKATNATVLDSSSDKQYIIVNFPLPGTALITLMVSEDGTSCKSNDAFAVHVGDQAADDPLEVIYFKQSLIVLKNDVDGYQWGYDDLTTLAPVTLPGEINQNYFNPSLDIANKHYWVITSHSGCGQKSYYNPPAEGALRPAAKQVEIYPNPANDNVNVVVKNSVQGDIMQVEVINMLGQKVYAAPFGNKAQIDISGFIQGCYLVNCYRNGIKIDATRFVKN